MSWFCLHISTVHHVCTIPFQVPIPRTPHTPYQSFRGFPSSIHILILWISVPHWFLPIPQPVGLSDGEDVDGGSNQAQSESEWCSVYVGFSDDIITISLQESALRSVTMSPSTHSPGSPSLSPSSPVHPPSPVPTPSPLTHTTASGTTV